MSKRRQIPTHTLIRKTNKRECEHLQQHFHGAFAVTAFSPKGTNDTYLVYATAPNSFSGHCSHYHGAFAVPTSLISSSHFVRTLPVFPDPPHAGPLHPSFSPSLSLRNLFFIYILTSPSSLSIYPPSLFSPRRYREACMNPLSLSLSSPSLSVQHFFSTP